MHWRKSGACFTSLSHAHATSFTSLTRRCAWPEATATCSRGHRVFCKKFQTISSKTGRCSGAESFFSTDFADFHRWEEPEKICVICGSHESFAGKKDCGCSRSAVC